MISDGELMDGVMMMMMMMMMIMRFCYGLIHMKYTVVPRMNVSLFFTSQSRKDGRSRIAAMLALGRRPNLVKVFYPCLGVVLADLVFDSRLHGPECICSQGTYPGRLLQLIWSATSSIH